MLCCCGIPCFVIAILHYPTILWKISGSGRFESWRALGARCHRAQSGRGKRQQQSQVTAGVQLPCASNTAQSQVPAQVRLLCASTAQAPAQATPFESRHAITTCTPPLLAQQAVECLNVRVARPLVEWPGPGSMQHVDEPVVESEWQGTLVSGRALFMQTGSPVDNV